MSSLLRIVVAFVACLGAIRMHGAGVTLITHGFNGNADGWVLGMARKIPGFPQFSGTNVIGYELTVTDGNVTARKWGGGRPTNDPNVEIVLTLDWGELAGFFSQYDTYEVAAFVVPRLLQTNFIAELNGHALAELPLHLIGHSRGGSLVCQMARLLGTNGVWVDQVTTLDPHPVNEDGNTDPLVVSDAPLRIYDNVLFADNYFQEFGGYPDGQMIPSSYNRRLTSLPGGYSSAHSDMHLWYHATIDFGTTANDTEATLSSADRAAWFTANETKGQRAGFHYGRIGGGNRLSEQQPAGSGTDWPRLGFNQRWDLGAGVSVNRTALPNHSGRWPSPIMLHLAGPNVVVMGQSNAVTLHYQWAQPATTNATVEVFLDEDLNPWNGNERLIQRAKAPGTTAGSIGSQTIGFDVQPLNATPGERTVLARITGADRTRCLYAPEKLAVLSSLQAPVIAISNASPNWVRMNIIGLPGQRVIVERTFDFRTWEAVSTNWLEGPLLRYLSVELQDLEFFRAVVR